MTSSLIFLLLGFQQPWSSPLPPTRPVVVAGSELDAALRVTWTDGASATEAPPWGLFRLGDEGEWLEVSSDARLELAAGAADLQGWSRGRAAAWLAENEQPRLRLRYALEDAAGRPLLAGVEDLRVGEPLLASASELRTLVHDLSVEIASAAPVADPVMALVGDGPALQVTVAPVATVGWLAGVGLVATDQEPAEDLDLGSRDLGGMERFAQRVLEAAWRTLLVPGEERTFSLSAPDGRSWTLRLTLEGAAPLGARALGETTWLDLPLLPGDDADALLLDFVGEGDLLFDADAGAVVLTGPGAVERAGFVEQRLAERYLPAPVALRWVEERDGSATAWDLAADAVVGAPVRVREGREFQVLSDWDVEVALGARIADPEFALVFDGLRLDAAVADAEGAHLTCTGERHVTRRDASRLLLLGAERRPVGIDGDSSVLPPVTVRVEPVRDRVLRLRGESGADPTATLAERSFVDEAGRLVRVRVVPRAGAADR